jgi:hypothetical protein
VPDAVIVIGIKWGMKNELRALWRPSPVVLGIKIMGMCEMPPYGVDRRGINQIIFISRAKATANAAVMQTLHRFFSQGDSLPSPSKSVNQDTPVRVKTSSIAVRNGVPSFFVLQGDEYSIVKMALHRRERFVLLFPEERWHLVVLHISIHNPSLRSLQLIPLPKRGC